MAAKDVFYVRSLPRTKDSIFPMRIFGIDFTSAPRPAKPIACMACHLEGNTLVLDAGKPPSGNG